MGIVVLGVVSLLWGVTGLVTIVFPDRMMGEMCKSLQNPWRRFWITQTLLLCGLTLTVGTLMLEGFWLWIVCGLVMVVKACLLLGFSDSFRMRLLQFASQWSYWTIRVLGVLNLGLAVLLAGDLILHG